MFDWVSFLDRNGIQYKEEPRRNIVSISCPFCGDDPSFHLGISTRGKGWHCWRNEISHTGKSPVRLIAELLNCSFESAAAIVYSESTSFPTTDGTFSDDVMSILGMKRQVKHYYKTEQLHLLEEFLPIERTAVCERLIYPYLMGRGYTASDVDELAEQFSLHYALNGRFAYRVIAPVYVRKRLVNWTGRSIVKHEKLRYRSLSDNPEKARDEGLPCAPMNIKDCLFDYDEITKGGRILVAVEGPFDAMRLSFFGREYGLKATAFFNTSPRMSQIELLIAVSELYDEFYGLFDQNADFQLFHNMPDYLTFKPKRLPTKVKDPAELNFRGFRDLFNI